MAETSKDHKPKRQNTPREIIVKFINRLGLIAVEIQRFGIIELFDQMIPLPLPEGISSGKVIASMLLLQAESPYHSCFYYPDALDRMYLKRLLGTEIKKRLLSEEVAVMVLEKIADVGFPELPIDHRTLCFDLSGTQERPIVQATICAKPLTEEDTHQVEKQRETVIASTEKALRKLCRQPFDSIEEAREAFEGFLDDHPLFNGVLESIQEKKAKSTDSSDPVFQIKASITPKEEKKAWNQIVEGRFKIWYKDECDETGYFCCAKERTTVREGTHFKQDYSFMEYTDLFPNRQRMIGAMILIALYRLVLQKVDALLQEKAPLLYTAIREESRYAPKKYTFESIYLELQNTCAVWYQAEDGSKIAQMSNMDTTKQNILEVLGQEYVHMYRDPDIADWPDPADDLDF